MPKSEAAAASGTDRNRASRRGSAQTTPGWERPARKAATAKEEQQQEDGVAVRSANRGGPSGFWTRRPHPRRRGPCRARRTRTRGRRDQCHAFPADRSGGSREVDRMGGTAVGGGGDRAPITRSEPSPRWPWPNFSRRANSTKAGQRLPRENQISSFAPRKPGNWALRTENFRDLKRQKFHYKMQKRVQGNELSPNNTSTTNTVGTKAPPP
jgi:hypothetical protein